MHKHTLNIKLNEYPQASTVHWFNYYKYVLDVGSYQIQNPRQKLK